MTVKLLLAACCTAACCGCHIIREQVNPHVRNIDISWIEPGTTTRDQIVERIGFPATARGIGGVTSDSFRWTLHDTRINRLEAGYIITPTLELSRAHYAEDILVKFDMSGIVSLVSHTVSDGNTVRVIEWKEAGK